ncbi:MAG: WD40/YVTN/BNR-like repeat-containing protein [Fimbriimonadales bacterium]
MIRKILILGGLLLVALAYSQASRTLKPDDLKGLSVRNIGPANMGGRVADIAWAPGKAKSFYVAFANGGVWKTDNAGTTFTPLFDGQETLCIGSVAAASGKDGEHIVWVGTGEGNGRNSSSWGNGVYRSSDSGSSWEHKGLEKTHDIPRLAVDPRNSDVCYVAAMGRLWGPNPERGIYKTADGGKNWSHSLKIDGDHGAIDVAVDPRTPDVVYAAMYRRRRTPFSFDSGSAEGGIFKSLDAGKTWTKLTKGLPKATGRIGLDIYPKNPKIVYAVVESDDGGSYDMWDDRSRSGGVFRSDDGGQNWVRVHRRVPRAFYFSEVRVDPSDDQKVYLLGWVIEMSDDGGKTFRGGFTKKPHVDMHAMAIDPSDGDHALIGNDGGIYQTWDRGKTWHFHNQLAVGQFYNLAYDMSEPHYRIGGGLQDNGSWIGPSRTPYESGSWPPGSINAGMSNAEWRVVGWGDGFHVAFDPKDPNIVYSESQGGEIQRLNMATGRAVNIKPRPKEGQPRFRFNWNSPFFISPHEPTTLYVGGNFVFRLTNRGDAWERISPDLTRDDTEQVETVGSEAETFGTVVSLAESPIRKGFLWAGSDDGLIHVTTDGGKAWQDVTPRAAGGWYIARIEVSRHAPDRAYVAVDGHRSAMYDPLILTTNDAGKTWKDLTGDLPKGRSVRVVREDLKNPRVLYCGTENGMYVSVDAGVHWVKLAAIPPAPVLDILQHPRQMDLIIGTHGRSIYVVDDASPISALTPAVLASKLHLFDVPTAKPEYRMAYDGFWGDQFFLAPNPSAGARITYWIREYTGDDMSIEISDAGGRTVRKLSGPNTPGIHRIFWDLQAEEAERLPNNDEAQGEPIFVPAGEYKATIALGSEKAEEKFLVAKAPGR